MPAVGGGEGADLQAQAPVGEHRTAGDLMRSGRAGGGDIGSGVRAHHLEPGQGDRRADALEEGAAGHAPGGGLDVHGGRRSGHWVWKIGAGDGGLDDVLQAVLVLGGLGR